MTVLFSLVGLLAAIVALVKASDQRTEIARLSDEIGQLRRDFQALLDLRFSDSRQSANPKSPEAEMAAAFASESGHLRRSAEETAVSEDIAPRVEPAELSVEDLTERKTAQIEEQLPIRDAELASFAAAARSAEETQRDSRPPPLPEMMAKPATPAAPAERNEAASVRSGAEAEKAFATRWTIWIGGIALAMGGLLIVRYSFEAGFFGPGVRLLMGSAFALAIAAAAEIIRRRELAIKVGSFASEDIPSVLAGVSVVSGFGVAYAAHAVYGMISSGAAFGLMGAIGLSALVVSLVYSPALGVLGLLGSYLTPFLVSSSSPNYVALTIFVSLVTCVTFALDARRPSTWLLTGAVVGHNGWTALIAWSDAPPVCSTFLLLVAAAVATFGGEFSGRRTERDTMVRIAAFVAPLVLGGVIWVDRGGDGWFRLTLVALVAVHVVASIRIAGLAVLAPIGAAAATGMILLWPSAAGAVGLSADLLVDMMRLSIATTTAPGLVAFSLLFGALAAVPPVASLLLRYRNGDGGPVSRGCLAFASALVPICIALAASLRLNGFNRTTGFALIASMLAIGHAAASELLFRREQGEASPQTDPLAYIASAAHAAAAAISVGLAVAFALRETWLVVGFAIACAGVALVARVRPIPLLRSMASALGTAALMRTLWSPLLTDVGDLPLLNWLVVVYGLPALAFAVAAAALSQRRDRALATVEALLACFLTSFVLLEVIQAFAGANLWAAESLLRYQVFVDSAPHLQDRAVGLLAVLSIVTALLSAVFMKLQMRTAVASPVYALVERILAVGIVPIVVGGLVVALNPLLNGMPVYEPVIVNRFLFGYVGTGVILGLLSRWLFPAAADGFLRPILEGLSIVLIALGATLILRHAFSGPDLSSRTLGSAAFFEAVSMTLLWLMLAGMVALWRNKRTSAVLDWSVVALGTIAAGAAALTLGVIRNPLIDHTLVEGPIVFNRILWGYAPVAVGFLLVARLVEWRETWLMRLLQATGLGAFCLMLFLLSRHGFHGPTLRSTLLVTLAETGVYGSVILIVAMACTIKRPARDRQDATSSDIVYAGAAVGIAIALVLAAMASRAPLVGWPLLNNATVGVFMPSFLAAVSSLWIRAKGLERIAERIYGVAAIAGGLFYVLLQVRLIFPEADMLEGWSPASGTTRFYVYSVVTLAYGVVLLVAGLHFQHRDLRMAALAVMALVICKVFLLDLAGLQGLWRAGSFIGLGASLIGVAYLYRWLMPPELAEAEPDRAK